MTRNVEIIATSRVPDMHKITEELTDAPWGARILMSQSYARGSGQSDRPFVVLICSMT